MLRRCLRTCRSGLGQEELIEMSIQPPLETRENGVVCIDKKHGILEQVKRDYGKEVRDLVIQCRREQIAFNDSGSYSAGTHIIDPDAGDDLIRMVPAEVVRRNHKSNLRCL
jgi:hypothetical protein